MTAVILTIAFWFGPALFAVGLNLAIANLERNPFTNFIPDSTTHSAPGGECRPEML